MIEGYLRNYMGSVMDWRVDGVGIVRGKEMGCRHDVNKA
jgi:hypothetical protein